MKALIIFAVLLMLEVVTSVPINESRVLVNRPNKYEIFQDRFLRKRSNPDHIIYRRFAQGVKGHVATGTKEYNPPHPLQSRVAKGEYVCGNRICKLQPGVTPKGCNGVCQYPVK